MQLFRFIQADLDAHRPKPLTTPGSSSSFDSDPTADPRFPKSLYLIQPLFSAYELNPVALAAQASVPVPEGLDLDAWIVAPPRESAPEEPANRKVKKVKKGKGKEVNSNKTRSVKKRPQEEENDDLLAPVEAEIETAEERAERARVGDSQVVYFLRC